MRKREAEGHMILVQIVISFVSGILLNYRIGLWPKVKLPN
jgi:hypothetical protein